MDPALGNGSRACGGAASQADGGRFAFGNTAEHLAVTTLGTTARGHRSEGPLDRRTGLGWVAATSKQRARLRRRGAEQGPVGRYHDSESCFEPLRVHCLPPRLNSTPTRASALP